MAVYISEVSYKESITEDFAEVAAPPGLISPVTRL